ncbi:MAG TPA: alpha/beta fold hydrolase, partial [Sphingomicrobium sp.]|nr:alpha/beta fold hydrolase [Sphingomicrobium sp.]
MRLAAAAFLILAAFLGAMMLSQDQLLFPTEAVPAAGPLPPGAEQIEARTDKGDTLRGVHIQPAGGVEGTNLLVLGFGGNAWNGQHVAEYLHEAFPQSHVIAFHYRGYRPSTGRPSAGALLEDAPLLLRAAKARVKPNRTVAVGFSIGSGVAASLAAQEVDGLILVTPFDSLKAVAAGLYPWLPIGPFFRHEI